MASDFDKFKERDEVPLPDDDEDKNPKLYRLNVNIRRDTRRTLKERCEEIADDHRKVSHASTKVVRALIMEFLSADPNDDWVKRVIDRSLKDKVES